MATFLPSVRFGAKSVLRGEYKQSRMFTGDEYILNASQQRASDPNSWLPTCSPRSSPTSFASSSSMTECVSSAPVPRRAAQLAPEVLRLNGFNVELAQVTEKCRLRGTKKKTNIWLLGWLQGPKERRPFSASPAASRSVRSAVTSNEQAVRPHPAASNSRHEALPGSL